MLSARIFRLTAFVTLGLLGATATVNWHVAYWADTVSPLSHGRLFVLGVVPGILSVTAAFVAFMVRDASVKTPDLVLGLAGICGSLLGGMLLLELIGTTLVFVGSSGKNGLDFGIFGLTTLNAFVPFMVTVLTFLGLAYQPPASTNDAELTPAPVTTAA